jgi:hypothetical protein
MALRTRLPKPAEWQRVPHHPIDGGASARAICGLFSFENVFEQNPVVFPTVFTDFLRLLLPDERSTAHTNITNSARNTDQ